MPLQSKFQKPFGRIDADQLIFNIHFDADRFGKRDQIFLRSARHDQQLRAAGSHLFSNLADLCSFDRFDLATSKFPVEIFVFVKFNNI